MFNSRIRPAQNGVNTTTKVNPRRNQKIDKRKRKFDRRKSVRDGVFVNLSFQNDRRSGVDRRRRQI